MVETMHKYDGVGLAAPQIGILKRLVVIDLYDEKGPIKLVNPKIVKEKGTQEVEEGCLSFPNQFGKVIRPEKVVMEALNEMEKNRNRRRGLVSTSNSSRNRPLRRNTIYRQSYSRHTRIFNTRRTKIGGNVNA